MLHLLCMCSLVYNVHWGSLGGLRDLHMRCPYRRNYHEGNQGFYCFCIRSMYVPVAVVGSPTIGDAGKIGISSMIVSSYSHYSLSANLREFARDVSCVLQMHVVSGWPEKHAKFLVLSIVMSLVFQPLGIDEGCRRVWLASYASQIEFRWQRGLFKLLAVDICCFKIHCPRYQYQLL